ncbi:M14 family metallopeptidase [Xanthomonas arboricola]|uniref:M14 family metallopeptidase n=1 Tax=Xanthomonas arboricola TaxID=56448 RepID=UPI0003A8AB4A|nr:M14 family metallopeptidase [Xanthomonas arboricola]MDN0209026.1 M14 family metallopeptidase [Xanthomonas arboricola pv. corylina]MDN0213441.1 M14 family metallopeptidase [Xanthomonas arboricola pv. corylina]PPU16395.1 carboxypeptidase [Xanthomonas arboricola pv. corylina]PPU63187.1 carboxypeptidase [Xanthomonas arboricola pv. corylina]QUI80189.1 M14 family metallopeptidase [Xanthomonas arboricola pv. corylina]
MTSDTRPSAPHASAPASDNAAGPASRSTTRAAAGLLAATLFTAAQASAQSIDTSAPLPPVRAWHGASEALIVAPDDPWSTPAERNDFASTPSYDETRAWLERLVAASPLLSLDVFGKSSEGRDLLLVRAHKGAPGKPVVLAQAGIHAGEIDGKDAGLMLLRDIAQRGKDHLLDQVDLVFVPIFNADGHEQRGPLIGAALRGPQQMGWNTTTRGINLNRDYLTLEAPETRAMVALLHRLDPALYIDLHVSGGLDHQYDITFTFAGWGTYARSRATADWLQQRFTPAVNTALRKQGNEPAIYPSLIDEDEPRSGLRYAPEGPRYSTGYGDFAGIPTVLVENHRLKSYRQRVLGDYVLLEAALRVVARDAGNIDAAKRADRAARPQELMVAWERLQQPIAQVPFKGVSYTRALSPVSGRQELRWEGRDETWTLPVIGYRQTQAVRYPLAWWIPPGNDDVVELLKAHGITYERLQQPRQLQVQQIRVVKDAGTQTPHAEPVEETFAAGSVRVPADQPMRMLAAALLEPQSSDSLLASGRFRNAGSPDSGLYGAELVDFSERVLRSDAALRAAFQRKLADDAAFRADGDARLQWIYARSPYAAINGWRYPVRRQLAE